MSGVVTCAVRPFAGVDSMLRSLTDLVPCAIVSSNTAANVRSGLGPELCACFAFIDGIDNASADKAEAIAAALRRLDLAPGAACYVGDTRKDCVKAREAGVRFVGVDYGTDARIQAMLRWASVDALLCYKQTKVEEQEMDKNVDVISAS